MSIEEFFIAHSELNLPKQERLKKDRHDYLKLNQEELDIYKEKAIQMSSVKDPKKLLIKLEDISTAF